LRTVRHLAAGALLALGTAGPALAAQDTPPVPIAAQDQRSLAVATDIIELSFPPAARRAMFASTVETFMAQARRASTEASGERLSPDVEAIIDRHLARARVEIDRVLTQASPALFAAMARAYARRFSYDELLQIRAFVATPTGAKFIRSGNDLMADPDVARANTAYMSAAFAALRPLEAQLMQELRAHLGDDRHGSADRPGGTR
jgi:hypothetical protein